MAVESSLSKDPATRNIKQSEPTKKLKKTRSIRLSKLPILKPSSRRSKSRFNWLSIDLNDPSCLLDFSDSGLNNVEVTNSSDAKKDSSQGGSEIDDSTSVESSSYGSPALSNLNQTTLIQKMLRNYKVSGSFRRRAKSRTVQPQHVLPVKVGDGSPNYLKATSSSDGRKADSQASSRNSSSLFENSDQCSSHVSTMKAVRKSPQTLARTPSMRSVRVQLNKTSLKPKRASFKSSHNSQDLNVDRATCSSTFKDKKFPDQVEFSVDGNAEERKSIMKVCPYQHCSLHGHNRDAAPAPNDSSYKKRQSLKPQTIMKPDTKSASVANVSGRKKQELLNPTSDLEFSSEDRGVHGVVLTPGKKEKDVSFSIEIQAKIKAQFSRKTDEETGESEASETTLGESSCFIESQDSLNEMMSSLIKSLSDLREKSIGCRCKSHVHEPSIPFAQEDYAVGNMPTSTIGCGQHEPTTNDQNEDRFVDNLTDLPMNTEAQVNEQKFDGVAEKSNPSTFFEDTNDQNGDRYVDNLTDLTVTPDGQVNEQKFDDVAEKSNLPTFFEDSDIGLTEQSMISTVKDHHSTEPLDTSAGENTSKTLENVLTLCGDIEDNKSVPVEDPEYSSHHEGFRAKLSRGKNISMWQLIHQQMASSLASDVEGKPPQTENEENQVEDSSEPAVRVSVDTERREDKDNQNDDNMKQDIEHRKVLAIKLVREAIEKILLQEVPDQSSDDQSTTSETTSEQDLSEQIHPEEYLKESINEIDASSDTKESGPSAGNKAEIQQVKTFKKLEYKSEKKAPKHWSNLKKWIILQRFVKALEKVKKFNPRGPRYLQLEPESQGEKVALRSQTVEEKKNAEEWMFDYALRQAIGQLAPTQKKKVSLLIKAFETVVPPQEESDIHSTISKLKETSDKSQTRAEKHKDSLSNGNNMKPSNLASPLTDLKKNSSTENEATNSRVAMVDGSQSLNNPGLDTSGRITIAAQELVQETKSHQEIYENGVSRVDANATCAEPLTSSSNTIVQEGEREVKNGKSRLPQGPYLVEHSTNDSEEEKKNHIMMWHMVYQHVVSSIVEKVGAKLLDGTDDEDSEDATEFPKFLKTGQYGGPDTYATLNRSGFSRSESVKLVQEAVDEILLPEIQDDFSETQSMTSDTVADQDLSEKSHLEDIENGNIGTKFDPENRSAVDDTAVENQQPEILKQNISKPPKMKNWSKLKKLMLLKRSITALENARKPKSPLQNFMQSKVDPQPETVDFRRQMRDEKKKAEQWMVDYAVQNIVQTLTPARKRRVALLVEAFEAVVPLPEI